MRIGYTMMCEQTGPQELVRDVVAAERVGFDFAVISDHYFPWLAEQGPSPYAWSVLGAAAQATERIPLMTYVTCPTFRYHPAVVAQKAATVALLSEGRFTLGLGAGENLNEHVIGGGWPAVDVRHERLREAVAIIRSLLEGGYVNHPGKHFDVESAKIWDLPAEPVPIGIAVSGAQSCALAGELADLMIAVEPEPELGASTGMPPRRRRGRTSSSAGSAAAGRSTPSCRDRRPSPVPRRTCGPRTSRSRSRAVPTWMRSSRPVRRSPRPASPTSRSYRSGASSRAPSWTGPSRTCCPSYAAASADVSGADWDRAAAVTAVR